MFSAKLCSPCSSRFLKGFGRNYYLSMRDLSSKKSNNRNKKSPQITVTAKNDFVTQQLNSSIEAHLRRQEKLWNHFQEEERNEYKSKKTDYYYNENTGTIERTQYHRMNRMDTQTKIYHRPGNQFNETNRINKKIAHEGSDESESSDNDSDDYSIEMLEPPNWENMNLIEINKNYYRPSASTENRSTDDISDFQSKNYIEIGHNVPKPIFKFDELHDLPQTAITEMKRKQFIECLPVQAQGIPIALSGANMIAVSPSK